MFMAVYELDMIPLRGIVYLEGERVIAVTEKRLVWRCSQQPGSAGARERAACWCPQLRSPGESARPRRQCRLGGAVGNAAFPGVPGSRSLGLVLIMGSHF